MTVIVSIFGSNLFIDFRLNCLSTNEIFDARLTNIVPVPPCLEVALRQSALRHAAECLLTLSLLKIILSTEVSHNAECHLLCCVMVSTITLNVILLNVVLPSDIILGFFILSVIILSFFTLSVIFTGCHFYQHYTKCNSAECCLYCYPEYHFPECYA